MNWAFSLKLMPGEEILEQPEENSAFGLKTVHTPILTNRRALFRFNSLSSGLIQSFTYEEITDARPANRLMIQYLRLRTDRREYYLNVDVPEEWALKILGYKEMLEQGRPLVPLSVTAASPAGRASPDELLSMLETLRDAGVLTDAEFGEKRKMVER